MLKTAYFRRFFGILKSMLCALMLVFAVPVDLFATTYSIQYDLNGGAWPQIQNPITGQKQTLSGSTTYDSDSINSNPYTPPTPIRIGYDLAYWRWDLKGTSYCSQGAALSGLYGLNTSPFCSGNERLNGNVKATAIWLETTYHIYYTLNGGTNNSNNPSTYGVSSSTITLQAPTKSNYTFTGWCDNAALTSECLVSKQIPSGSTGDKNFYARWSPKVYTLTLNKQSGSGGANSIYEKYNTGYYKEASATTQITTSGGAITAPTRAGYTFGGYYTGTSGSGTQIITSSGYLASGISTTRFTSNTTLYAKWTPITYTVKYYANGGSGTMSNQSMTYGTSANLRSNTFTRTGYSFWGWCKGGTSCSSPTYSDGQSVSNLTTTSGGTVSLYAMWTADSYSIWYLYPRATGRACLGNDVTEVSDSSHWCVVNTRPYLDPKAYNINNSSVVLPTASDWATYYSSAYGIDWANEPYTFDGWYLVDASASSLPCTQHQYDYNNDAWSTCSGNPTVSFTPDANNLVDKVFMAKFTPNNYTITLDSRLHGGSGNPGTTGLYTTYGTGVYLDANRTQSMTNTGNTSTCNPITVPTGAQLTVNYYDEDETTLLNTTTARAIFNGYQYKSYTILSNGCLTEDGLDLGRVARNDTWYADWGCNDVTLMTPAARDGYVFDGWYKYDDGVLTKVADGGETDCWDEVYDVSLDLYAKWNPIEYTITFVTNNGTCTNGACDAISYDASDIGTTFTFPTSANISRAGWTFAGWYDNGQFTGNPVSSFTPNANNLGNKTYYAKWLRHCDAGSYMPANSSTCSPCGVNHYCPADDYEPEPSGSDRGIYSCPALYPLASAYSTSKTDCHVDIVFNSNGGDTLSNLTVNCPETDVANYSETTFKLSAVPATLPTPTKQYNVFDAWYKESDFSGSAVTTNTSFTSSDLNNNQIPLYANWTQYTYTIHFNKNATDATGSTADQSMTYGVADNLNTNGFSRTGYEFGGWCLGSTTCATADYTDGESVSNLSSTNGATVNMYAKWNPITYTIHFDKNNTSATGSMTDQPMTYGVAANLNSNGFSLTDYALAGWCVSSTCSGTVYAPGASVSNLTTTNNATVTLYAKWLRNSGSCSAGYYYDGTLQACKPCTAGNYCPGENFDGSLTTDQGIYSCSTETGGLFTLSEPQSDEKEDCYNAYTDTISCSVGNPQSFAHGTVVYANDTAAASCKDYYRSNGVYTDCTLDTPTDCDFTVTCDTGYTWDSNTSTCKLVTKACSVGNYYDAATNTCVTCSAGSYCPGKPCDWVSGSTALSVEDDGRCSCAERTNGEYPDSLGSQYTSQSINDCFYSGNTKPCSTLNPFSDPHGTVRYTNSSYVTTVNAPCYIWYGYDKNDMSNCVLSNEMECQINLSCDAGYHKGSSGSTILSTLPTGTSGTYNYTDGSYNLVFDYGTIKIASKYSNTATKGSGLGPGLAEVSDFGAQSRNRPTCWCKITSFTPTGSTEEIPAETYWTGFGTLTNCSSNCAMYISNQSQGTSRRNFLYATPPYCEANTYTVTFNANGGVGTMADQSMTYDVAANLNPNEFTRDGYAFAGWCTKAGCSGTGNVVYTDEQSVSNLTTTNNGTVTLYAKWNVVCDAGYYLPANSTTCVVCTANNYCPGSGSAGFEKRSSIQGRYNCSANTSGVYTLSDVDVANNVLPTSSAACYRSVAQNCECVDNATCTYKNSAGKMYYKEYNNIYHTRVYTDLTQCNVQTFSCNTGYVQTTIAEWIGRNITAVDQSDGQPICHLTSSHTCHEYCLKYDPQDGETCILPVTLRPGQWVVSFYTDEPAAAPKKAPAPYVVGDMMCGNSAAAGVGATISGTPTTGGVGENVYCYVRASSLHGMNISNPWVYTGSYASEEACKSYCGEIGNLPLADKAAVMGAMITNAVASGKNYMCTPELILDWDTDTGDVDTAGSGTCGYGLGIGQIEETSRTGYTFAGWTVETE